MPPSGDQQDTRGPTGIAGVLRNLGRLNRPHPVAPAAPIPPNVTRVSGPEYYGGPPNNDLLYAQLRPGNSINDRVNAAKSFLTIVVEYALSSVTEIWLAAQDLLNQENPPEARQIAFKLMTACIKQSEPSSLDRLQYYKVISSHPCIDDFDDQLLALMALTNNGKNVTSFERDILILLSRWVRIWFREAAFARSNRRRENGAAALSAAEFNFSQLMKFSTDIVKFNHSAFEERHVNTLLENILQVCKKTTSRDDIMYSLTFIDVLITYGYIPRQTLTPCIEVLCGAYTTVKELADTTWNAVANLCRSYMSHNTILVLREILEAPSKKSSRVNNSLRGAVYFLERLLMANEADGLPQVQFTAVMASFRAALSAKNARLDIDIAKAIKSAFHNEMVMSQITFDEWALPLDILVHCAKRTTERADGVRLENAEGMLSPISLVSQSSSSTFSKDKDNISSGISAVIFEMIQLLEEQCTNQRDLNQMEVVIDFFVRIYGHLPDSAADMVIEYYRAEHLCYPSCTEWVQNIQQLLNIFFKSKIRPAELRISVLMLIKDVYETIKGVCDEQLVSEMILYMFENIREEEDNKVLDALVRIAVDVAGDEYENLFNRIIEILAEFIPQNSQNFPQNHGLNKSVTLPSDSTVPESQGNYGSALNLVTTGLVKIFIRNMHTSARRAVCAYLEIVKIAGSVTASPDARLTAMRLLFRIRSDAEHAILLVESTESSNMAAFLSRNEKPVDEKENSPLTSRTDEEAVSGSRQNRSNSITQNSLTTRASTRGMAEKFVRKPARKLLWTYPEKQSLPEKFTEASSTVLCTYKDPPAPGSPPTDDYPHTKILSPDTCVRMALLMEQVIIPIIQSGTDWEIYSYVLVNLASQLSNKTAFRNCTPHIRMLRGYICDQLHTNRIPNTDLPDDVKKADIAVVLIHLLTTLIAYNEHFARNEQEAIVKAFQLGLHSWQRTAKPCIHALSVCCYELPMPTSKFLSGILTKLSQIITSSAVSVHILEFLSALARLPNLYANFTEPDFRNVFGIAFRYIQHTKETTTQQPQRTNYPGRGIKDSNEGIAAEQPVFPQYVLTLAYNVLTTWFLALRLSERHKYVPWITKGLVLGHGDNNKDVDEQSQACIDMLQRFTYSDAESQKPPPRSATQADQYIQTKSWLYGLSVLSVNMDTVTGESSLTVRRPSSTSYFHLTPQIREVTGNRRRVPEAIAPEIKHESGNVLDKPQQQVTVMPSHIILQLVAGIGGPSENSRPLAIPDDQRSKLALEVLDRIPVVDFHKIGVVYAGAGQSHERQILQNVMGSTDYTEFVAGLGNLIKLKDSTLNTGGLDRAYDTDGEFTYFWSDRITEIIYHVTTMMPVNLEHDPNCNQKKSHIGNDFVNIIFNNSGIPYAFDTIPAQFSFVNIIISPEARAGFVTTRLKNYSDMSRQFYRVEVQVKPGIPSISPAAEMRVISGKSLPAFVRNLALNASVFSHVHNEGGGEHITNWRHRLRSINKLRERVMTPLTGQNSAQSPTTIGGQAGPNAPANSRRVSSAILSDHAPRSTAVDASGLPHDAGNSEVEALLNTFDFSRWS